jgi:putative ABC transport system substrate-binding protein
VSEPIRGRRQFLASLSLLATAAVAQQGRRFRIGYLGNMSLLRDIAARKPSNAAVIMVDGLRKLGWIEGENIEFIWMSAEGDLDRIPALAKDLVRQRPDLIIAFGGGVESLVELTSTIPIVMAGGGLDRLGSRVASVGRPMGNVTGILVAADVVTSKHLALLREAVPGATRIALAVNGFENPQFSVESVWPDAASAAARLGLTVFLVHFRTVEDMASAFSQAVTRRAQAMLFAGHPLLWEQAAHDRIGEMAVRHRMPVITSSRPPGEAGGILAYSQDAAAIYRRAPYFVDRILRGARPGDLPLESPPRYELVVNLKAARAIGLAVPAALRVQADYIIE